MILHTMPEALERLRETVKATKETHCLVYTGHGVVEILKEKDCKGYTVIEKYNATYNMLLAQS
tara:strand:+ start:258 stop:446 length:189 start_codon:yes stop_codon:yes gene_type:complete